jgi:16S rRNA (guanine1207-N2)-methyltransferase
VGDRSGHYFDERPTGASRPATVPLVLPDLSLSLAVDRGVFSPERVDPGTKLLLLELPSPGGWPPGPVVDVGAGYGPVAVTLALRDHDREVWAVEVNERARELCIANAAAAGVADRVRVVAPDEVPDDLRPGLLVSNPPIRIGKTALHDLLAGWLDRLTPGGEAWLVVQKHLGADSLARWLADRGHDVTRTRSRQGYRVLRVTSAA